MEGILNNIQWNGLTGPSVNKLIAANMDPGILRPFCHNGKSYVSLTGDDGKQQVHQVSNVATLPHEAWIMIDTAVQRAAQQRLKAVADLRGQGLTFNIANGMGVPVLMTQRASRVGTAQVAMDPVEKGPNDRPVYDSLNLPLPVAFSDWSFSARDLAVSRRGNLPLDTQMAEDSARAVSETLEKMLIGNSDFDQFTYGGGTIYGYTDFPSRITFTITAPSTGGWVGQTLLHELLAAKQSLINSLKFGPYILYMSPAWSQYLSRDYNSTQAGQTLTINVRTRLLQDEAFSEIRFLDYLTGWDILMVQMETGTVREVIGMDMTTVQWEGQGGLELNFKVMTIQVPHLQADYDGNCGIAHGTV
jgi:hypothetical protein